MKKLFYFLPVLPVLYALFFTSCASDAHFESERDSLRAILDEYIQRDSIKSGILKGYDASISKFGYIQDSIAIYQKAADSLKNLIKSNSRATSEQNKELQHYMSQIRNLIAQNEELASDLENSGYKTASMSNLIKIMYASVEDKQARLRQTEKEITELKTKVKGLETKVSSLTQENSDLASAVSDLSGKVARISGSIKVIQPKERKAKKIQNLNIVCNLKANPDAPKGVVNIYFRIVNDKGELLQNPQGDFFYEGQEIAYTVKTTVDYQGDAISKNVTWSKTGQNLEAGKYTVDFYIENRKEGQDTFVLDR
jgi:DNA repair ATPase RecN